MAHRRLIALNIYSIVTKVSTCQQAYTGNLALVSKYNTHLQTQCYSTKDIVQSIQAPQDFLMQNLKSSLNASSVLEIVGMHVNIMNERHLIQALKTLFELQKSGCSILTNQQIIRSPEFNQLCRRFKSQARAVDLNDTIGALKIISYIGVPSRSTIIQVLLQLVRYNVNDLSLQQIVFLDFILTNFESCPLVDALKIALPLVFEAQLSIKMDRTNIFHNADLLHYASKKQMSSRSIKLLIEVLEDRAHEMDIKVARSVVWSLSDTIKLPQGYERVLTESLDVLTNNIHQCTREEVESVLSSISRKYSPTYPHFYHEAFLKKCVEFLVAKDSGFISGIWILRNMTRIGYTSIDLLDYLANKVVKEPQLVEKSSATVLISLINGLSNADYKPDGWPSIQEAILKNNIIYQGKLELPWLKFAVELASLDCICPKLLERILEENFLNKFLSREYNLLDHLQLLLLYQALVTLFPSYMGILPPEPVIKHAIASNRDNFQDFPLEAALERGLGGTSYVQTKLYTKLGHFIDHVVVMRKGGYPIAMNQAPDNCTSRTYIEDLQVPANSQIIAILALQPGCYVNCNRLKGPFKLFIRSLEALGHSVVEVPVHQWLGLPDHEKIPYLMQNIKLKCEIHSTEMTALP